jgi:hypothetical protein
VRLRPERPNHVWSYDFVSARTHDGRTIRVLTLIDEYTRACLAIRVARRLGRYEVIETVADVMLLRASRKIFARTMDLSSSRRICGSGWRKWSIRKLIPAESVWHPAGITLTRRDIYHYPNSS